MATWREGRGDGWPSPKPRPAQAPEPPARVLDAETAARWGFTLMHLGTRAQLDRAAEEIRALYAATPEQRSINAANLRKLRESWRISANILARTPDRR